ncbi:MAG: hypothetical protein ACPMAG_10690, partial [Limisphaerales bacterium]
NKYQNRGRDLICWLCDFFEGWWLSKVTKRCCVRICSLNTALQIGLMFATGLHGIREGKFL